MFWSFPVPQPTKTLLLPLKKVLHREARLNNLRAGGIGGEEEEEEEEERNMKNMVRW